MHLIKDWRSVVGFDDRWLRLLGIPMLAFCLPLIFDGVTIGDGEFSHLFKSSLFYTFIYWHVDWLLINFFRRRWPSITQYKKRISWQLASVLAFTGFFSWGSCVLLAFLANNYGLPQDQVPPVSRVLTASMFATVVVMAIYEVKYLVSRWKISLVEAERLKKQTMQAQLETLKNQVNPHFLFNSLNTLATIIPEDPKMAVEFVQKLSKVYRYILEIKKREMIPLREELECISAYRFLLDIRFGSNFTMDINIPEHHLEDHIVPLSLQILIENAIKHNIVSTAKPLKIKIGLNKSGDIVVSNNLQKKIRVSDSTGTGLANIDSRYKLLSGKSIEVITSHDYFRVVIPLIKVSVYESIDN